MTSFRAASLLALGLLTAGAARAVPATPRLGLNGPMWGLLAPTTTPAPLVAPTVPATVEFAGMTLDLTDGARTAVQRLVDALYRHPTYLQQKIDRADTYFPIIDRVFKEEGVPPELRYLALQESGLVSDAVSSSNAVGFWQMKKEAAADFNLRVNNDVDERRHIVESSRGAARYFKRSNAQLDNWVNTLMSYYTGLGGAKRLVPVTDTHAQRMAITEATHPYVITFLAHKLAFEGRCGQNLAPALRLEEVKARPGQTLDELAQSLNANPADVTLYNKWLLATTVPADKQYSVLVPVAGPATLVAAVETPAAVLAFPAPLPEVNPQLPPPEITQINGLKAVVARAGDTPDILALVVGMDTKRFRALNDLGDREGVVEGRTYYLQRKRNKATVEYHVVQATENLGQISQQYGVRVKAILRKNRMAVNDPLQPGRLLWLQHTRPKDVPAEFMSVAPAAPVVAAASASSALPPAVAAADSVTAAPGVSASATASGSAPTLASSTGVVVKPSEGSSGASEGSSGASTTPSGASTTSSAASTTSPGGTKPSAAPTTAVPAIAPVSPMPVKAPTPATPAPPKMPVPVAPPVATPPVKVPVPATPPPPGPPVTAPAPMPAPRPTIGTGVATPAGQTHTVLKGETLSAIARQHGVRVADLMARNNLTAADLRPGQVLAIGAPAPGAAPAPTLTPVPDVTDAAGITRHTLAPGESLYRLAKQYNVTVEKLMEWNGLTDFNVKLGQSLIVGKK